jgi:hypothetical protein
VHLSIPSTLVNISKPLFIFRGRPSNASKLKSQPAEVVVKKEKKEALKSGKQCVTFSFQMHAW